MLSLYSSMGTKSRIAGIASALLIGAGALWYASQSRNEAPPIVDPTPKRVVEQPATSQTTFSEEVDRGEIVTPGVEAFTREDVSSDTVLGRVDRGFRHDYVVGATVDVSRPGMAGPLVGSTSTNNLGNFSVPALSRDTMYTVKVTTPDGRMRVSAAEAEQPVHIHFGDGNDVNISSANDSIGRSVLFGWKEQTLEGKVVDKEATFLDVADGTYGLFMTSSNGSMVTDVLNVFDGVNQEYAFPEVNRIQGAVYDKATEQPIEGATLTFTLPDVPSNLFSKSMVTSYDGHFGRDQEGDRISLPALPYTVTIDARDQGYMETLEEKVSFPAHDPVIFYLSRGASLEGIVVNEQNQPMKNVPVTLCDEYGQPVKGFKTVTGNEGKFSIIGIDPLQRRNNQEGFPQSYTAIANKVGFSQDVVEGFNLSGSSRTFADGNPLRIQLVNSSYTFDGLVLADNQPTGALVESYFSQLGDTNLSISNSPLAQHHEVLVGSNGRFSLEGLRAGTHSLLLHPPKDLADDGYFVTRKHITIPSATSPTELALDQGVVVSGYIRSLNDQSVLPGANIGFTAQGEKPRFSRHAIAREDGSYSVGLLPGLEYTVHATSISPDMEITVKDDTLQVGTSNQTYDPLIPFGPYLKLHVNDSQGNPVENFAVWFDELHEGVPRGMNRYGGRKVPGEFKYSMRGPIPFLYVQKEGVGDAILGSKDNLADYVVPTVPPLGTNIERSVILKK